MTEQNERLTHLREDGAAHMVDVSDKAVTTRRGRAEAVLVTRPDVIDMMTSGGLAKGEAFGTARLAGIMAAKSTSTLIPLCHPLPITSVDVDLRASDFEVHVRATVTTVGRTGVEMEALVAASVAAMTLYDMVKGVDRAAYVRDLRVSEKSGGRSGEWVRS